MLMTISAFVPQVPIERVRTNTDPSEVGGSGRSTRPAVSGYPGTIAMAFIRSLSSTTHHVMRDPHDKAAFLSQVPDWSRGRHTADFRDFASAVALHLENILPKVRAEVTIIHTEHPPPSPTRSRSVVSRLPARYYGQLIT
jgi:hypothetical protein